MSHRLGLLDKRHWKYLRMDHLNFTDSDPEQHATDGDVEWKRKFDAWNSRLRARQVALKAAAAGPAPYVVQVSLGVLFAFGPLSSWTNFVVLWFLAVALAGIYIALVGYGSAWVAHRFAYGTTVPVERLARGLVWTANLTLWGWGLVGLFSTR